MSKPKPPKPLLGCEILKPGIKLKIGDRVYDELREKWDYYSVDDVEDGVFYVPDIDIVCRPIKPVLPQGDMMAGSPKLDGERDTTVDKLMGAVAEWFVDPSGISRSNKWLHTRITAIIDEHDKGAKDD